MNLVLLLYPSPVLSKQKPINNSYYKNPRRNHKQNNIPNIPTHIPIDPDSIAFPMPFFRALMAFMVSCSLLVGMLRSDVLTPVFCNNLKAIALSLVGSFAIAEKYSLGSFRKVFRAE